MVLEASTNKCQPSVKLTEHLLYSGLILRGGIFVDWIVKTIRGYIFELKSAISPDKFHCNSFSRMSWLKISRIEQNP